MTIGIASQRFVLGLASVVAVFIVATCVFALFVDPVTFAERKEQFQVAVTQTLLPMFTAIATTIVAYVLGQAIVSALRPDRPPRA